MQKLENISNQNRNVQAEFQRPVLLFWFTFFVCKSKAMKWLISEWKLKWNSIRRLTMTYPVTCVAESGFSQRSYVFDHYESYNIVCMYFVYELF